MRKLIFLIPTGGKTKKQVNEDLKIFWPEIRKKIEMQTVSQMQIVNNK